VFLWLPGCACIFSRQASIPPKCEACFEKTTALREAVIKKRQRPQSPVGTAFFVPKLSAELAPFVLYGR
jgi:hypothetical protein